MHSNKCDIHGDEKCENYLQKCLVETKPEPKQNILIRGVKGREKKEKPDLIRNEKPGLPFLNVKWGYTVEIKMRDGHTNQALTIGELNEMFKVWGTTPERTITGG